jgi:anti-anti-sigma regulatory factor
MFRISMVETRSQRKLVVEGRLTEPWVPELVATWRSASRDLGGRKLVIDLNSLTVISTEGEGAIFDLMKQGAKFSCGSICTGHMLKRLARECQSKLRQGMNRTHMETETSTRR